MKSRARDWLRQAESELGIDGDIEKMGRRLDVYYISARYPDAFVEGAPFEYFDKDLAEEALLFAGRFLDLAQRELGEDG